MLPFQAAFRPTTIITFRICLLSACNFLSCSGGFDEYFWIPDTRGLLTIKEEMYNTMNS